MVRPSVFIVGKPSGNNKVTIRNDAEKIVHIIIPHDTGFETEFLEPAAKGAGHKKDIDVTDKKQN